MRKGTLLGGGLLTLAALGGVLGLAAPAQATPVQATPTALSFNLTCPIGGSPCGNTVFGTVTLTQVDSKTVSVSETLAPGNVFVGNGAGDALMFNVNAPDIILSNINLAVPGLFAIDLNLKGLLGGNLGYGIDYKGNGISAPNATSLSFTVSDLTSLSLSNFVQNSAGFYFTSDIGVANGRGGFTIGNVSGNTPGVPPTSAIPEPTSLLLLGAGLIGLIVVVRRSRPVASQIST